MSVILKDITQDNFLECISLSLSEDQKGYVSENVKSIAESKLWPFWIPKAIYENEDMVGFLMYAKDYEDGKLDICRLMIDRNFQKKGYGTKSIEDMIIIAKSDAGINRIVVHIVKENDNAKKFYIKNGFIDLHTVEYGQDVFILNITR